MEWGPLRAVQLRSEFTETYFGTSTLKGQQSFDHKMAKSPLTDFTKGVVWESLKK